MIKGSNFFPQFWICGIVQILEQSSYCFRRDPLKTPQSYVRLYQRGHIPLDLCLVLRIGPKMALHCAQLWQNLMVQGPRTNLATPQLSACVRTWLWLGTYIYKVQLCPINYYICSMLFKKKKRKRKKGQSLFKFGS